jgi:putative endonuclease
MKLSPRKEPFRMSLGKRGEIVAANFLAQNGYKILEQNYRCEIGEIDVIAEKDGRILFVEVKTRSSEHYGLPQESVHEIKQRKISRSAEWYLKEKRFETKPVGFEVIAVQWKEGGDPEIRLISNAFSFDQEL